MDLGCVFWIISTDIQHRGPHTRRWSSYPYHTLTQSALQIPVSRRLEANRHEESFLAFERRCFTWLIGHGGLEQDWKHSATSSPNKLSPPAVFSVERRRSHCLRSVPFLQPAAIRTLETGLTILVAFLARDYKSDCPPTHQITNSPLQRACYFGFVPSVRL